MKTTEFITENPMIGADAQAMHEVQQNHMLRQECYTLAVNAVAVHKLLARLEGADIDAWASEKISLANDYLNTVKEWLEYDVLGAGKEVQGFDAMIAEGKYKAMILDEEFAQQFQGYYNDGAKDARDVKAYSNPFDPRKEAEEHHAYKRGFDSAKPKLKEEASAGATGSPSVAVVSSVLGEKGGFSKQDVQKRLEGYTNQMTPRKQVKLPKAK
jgi:hypothetical protein